ncbi:histidine kinase [Paenibacillus antarcticus]|uniref:Histidine kinase n=1 Tax=Paenibacillus antarcticus TaxID=253703 RepID=A0A168NK99_9BACL|nr:histidine kinase [Paenibacillus antarcticus]
MNVERGIISLRKIRILRFKSIGMKLFVILFCGIVALSTILGLSSYQLSKGIIKDEVSLASSQAIVQAADKLDFLFLQYEALSKQLAVDSDLKHDLETINQAGIGTLEKRNLEEGIRSKLSSISGSDSRLLGVRLVKENLVEVDSYKSTGISGVRSDDDIQAKMKEIEEAKGQIVWFPTSRKGFFNSYAEPALTMGRLLRNMNHPEAEYILLFEIKEKSIAEMLSNLQIGVSGQVEVITDSNRIVHAKDNSLLELQSFIHINKESAGGETTFTADDEEGIEQLVVYKTLKTTKWTMMGYAPISDFVKGTNQLLYVTLIVILLSVMFALFIGYYVFLNVGRPLAKLCNLMEEGERGNLQVRTTFQSEDEIGRLGSSFNQMMHQIGMLVDQTNRSAQEVLETADELTKVSKSTSLSAGEIADASREIAVGASNLAMEAESESMLAEHIAEKIHKVSTSNYAMEQLAHRVLQVSGQGSDYMDQLVHKTDGIVGMNRAIVSQAEVLKKSTASIQKILELMSNLTQQTNILSMNATIEAARAGEAGRGFMVVANEIRNLADSSKQSIQTVAEITDEIRRGIEHTTASLNAVSPVMAEQLVSVKEASTMFQNVKQEMDDFLTEIDNSSIAVKELIESQRLLSVSITCISAVVEETSASTEEVASMSSQQYVVSEKLVGLSNRLEEMSETFKHVLVKFKT